MPRRKAPVIPDDLLDQLLAGGDAATALNTGGLLDALKKALAERALNAEMDYYLDDAGEAGNTRNGYGRKTVTTGTGKVEIEVPRDRAGTFDPQLIARYQRRFKFWLRVMNELKNRGIEDILLAVVDGLKGFPEAITAVFPEAMVQTGHLEEPYDCGMTATRWCRRG